mgnify:CR=1 FL=1
MSRASDPVKLAAWRERLERFSSCGLAVTRFCAREGVSAALFYHWRKKLGANGRRGSRPLLGPKGRRRRRADDHPQHRTSLAGGRGLFQPVEVVPAQQGAVRGAPVPARLAAAVQGARAAAVRGAPAAAPAARGFVPIASGWVPAARAVCIQLPCGTRIEIDAGELDALRAVVAEVVRADRAWEAAGRADCSLTVARADRGRDGVVA